MSAPPPGSIPLVPEIPLQVISLLYGPMLIGVFLNCVLFGVMFMQAFIYFQTYKEDAKWIRWFIAYLCVAETVNTACDIYTMYQALIQEFGTVTAITFFPTFIAAAPFTTVAISSPIQIFTAWRVGVIMQSWWIPAIIAIFVIVSTGGAFTVGINVITLKFLADKDTFRFTSAGVIWFVASAIADILITVSLVWSLSRRRAGGASNKRTNVSIDKIIRLTIQTGAVTMVFALADMLFFSLSPKTAISFVWDFSIGKLYTNALLSTLNARAGWSRLNDGNESNNVLFGDQTTYRSNMPTGVTMGTNTYVSTFRATKAGPTETTSGFELDSKPQGLNVNVRREVQMDV